MLHPLERWTKLFWFDVLWEKFKTSKAMQIVVWLFFLKSNACKVSMHAKFFYIERKKDLRTDYQNWGLNHKSTENSAISDKKSYLHHHRSVRPVLLCEENRHAFVICFAISTISHEEGAIIHPNSNIILWYNSGLESETFKSCYYQWMAARQTRQTSKRPIFCQEQFKDLKEDHFLKTVSYFPPNKLQVLLVFFFFFFLF